MYNNIVIFGASGGGTKLAKYFKNLGMDILFYVDNDKTKYGQILEGKEIRSPLSLLDASNEYSIVIASMYHEEIMGQLTRMGIKQEQVVLKETILIELLLKHIVNMDLRPPSTMPNKADNSIVVDLVGTTTFGGIEKWSITLAKALSSRNKEVTILTDSDAMDDLSEEEYVFKKFELSNDWYKEKIKAIAEVIAEKLPCTVFINRVNHVFMAALIIKKLYGKQINIVSVIHSDFMRRYEQNSLFKNEIDAFLCVSPDIKRKLLEYQIDENRVFFMDSPVLSDSDYIKKYSTSEESIILGYGGRIEKNQKRADLLIPLIQRLEGMGVRYVLNIAGGGTFYQNLEQFVMDNHLEDKVKLCGVLPYKQMDEFWKKVDIFINLSDMEGTSLSMLEAMSFGAVPIVTNTSGVEGFIQDDINGYVCSIGDVNSIAQCIKRLSDDRAKLYSFGKIAREVIQEKCNLNKYIDFVEYIIIISMERAFEEAK